MRCPTLAELPPPPPGRTGWPWREETPRHDVPADDCVLISIVLPSYNQGAFIEETLRSVLLQGHPSLEVILCDDGSTDATSEIIGRYEPWLTLAPEAHPQGMSRAINRGFARATGEIITWISTDDVYLADVFQEVADLARGRSKLGAIVGGFEFIDSDSHRVAPPRPSRLDLPSPLDLSRAPLESWRLHQVSTFYTASGLDRAGRHVREDLDYVMDRDLLFRVARENEIALVSRTLAQFRLHPASKSWSSRRILDFSREFAALQDDFLTGDPAADRERRAIKKRRLSKGYLKYGARGDSMVTRISSLLKAATLEPGLLLTRDFGLRWLAALGVESAVRRLLGKDPEATLARGI